MTYASFVILSLGTCALAIPTGVAAEPMLARNSNLDRSPAIIGPATDAPIGESAEYYRDYLENDVHLEPSDS